MHLLSSRIFDEVAERYDAVRPTYPIELRDAVAAYLPAGGGRILEIGCGTGQATSLFAPLGHSILALEPGPRLAALAAKKLQTYAGVAVETVTFEEWDLVKEPFDMVLSATAFHWVHPEIRYIKTVRALKEDGTLAIFWNVPADEENTLSREIQKVYDQHMHGNSGRSIRQPLHRRIQAWVDEIDRSALFGPVAASQFPWSEWLPTDRYLQLLETYSDHYTLPETNKRRLYDGLTDILERNGGGIQKAYVATLYTMRKRLR
ncbi:methyltransferase type 11 [Capsulimonas corticalis]|uniref:Methyltransferase type 11 n=1 Tax=Capsulimonas corticalis TaxID=2219043 RepID=A0A402CTE0_9BACT|nr:class I SAM-dependent methyltransferase [Capsulimonas corticalis]BDI30778.1 methyltransferase type 11 [Capsulimonas corticalis]